MSNSPLLRRPNAGTPQPLVMPLQTSVRTVFSSGENDGDSIIDTLRGALATGSSELDPILTSIAEAAQTLTGASGSALALRTNGAVICRARSGDTAPEIGAQLSDTSGISGECLRSGKILRCDDTQKDYRVNPEVCRGMGLHSMALVPVRARQQVAGVLEVFSTRAYAFGEPEINMLRRVAELAEAAYLQELSEQSRAEPQTSPVHELTPVGTWVHPDEDALRRLGTHVTIEELRIRSISRSRLLIPAVVLLVLLSSIAWKIATRPKHQSVAVAALASSASPASAETAAVIARGGLTTKRARAHAHAMNSGLNVSVERKPRQDRDAQASDVVKRTAASEPVVQPVVQPNAAPAANAPDAPKVVEASQQAKTSAEATQQAEAAPAPKLENVAETKTPLGNLFVSPVAPPKFEAPVSDGVSGGKLERRINPVYPREAVSQHLEGAVVLDATVNRQGKVQKVKTLSGNPILARAATDAVRQWQYSPFQLNGKPVVSDTQITVNFKAPSN
jgi:TonB family protein